MAMPTASSDRRLRASHIAADLAAVVAAFGLASLLDVWLRGMGAIDRGAIPVEHVVMMAVGFGFLTVILGLRTGAYESGASVLQFVEIRAALRALAIAAAVTFALLFITQIGDDVSRALLSLGMLLSAVTVVIGRRLLSVALQALGVWQRYAGRTLIVGGGTTACLLMKKIVQAPASGLKVVGFVADYRPIGSTISCRLRQGEPEPFDAPVLGRTWQIRELLARHSVSTVLVSTDDVSREALDEIIQAADAARIDLGFVPRLGGSRADVSRMEDITAIPVLRREPLEEKPAYEVLKRGLDLLVAIPLLLLCAPLMAAAALWIRLDSPGPALFRQLRVGRHGKTFTIVKFRTMRPDAERFSRSPDSERDPRITRAGRILRLAGVDELPQLLNVLRGDMSMVGPRPEMPFIAESYSDLERERLVVKPGITGLWQLSPDRDVEIHENLEYDLYYVRNRSILLDLVILFETFLFTLATLWRRLFGRERSWRRTERAITSASATTPSAAAREGAFVLLALDQRDGAPAPTSWSRLAYAVLAAGAGFVKVLVAPNHLPSLEGLGDGRADGATAPEPRMEFVPYRSSAELCAWTDAAATVVTDLEHVRDRAARRCVDVVFLSENAPDIVVATERPDGIARRLGRMLTELPPPG